MAIKVYYSPQSSAVRVLWALEELGVPYEKERLHLDKGDQKKPEFLAINPFGKVPAMVDGEQKLFESCAILLHLGARYGAEKHLWAKPGTVEIADMVSWTVWANTELTPTVIARIMHTSDRPFAFPPDKRHPFSAEKALEQWKMQTEVLEKRLTGREWLVGNAFSLCDLAVGGVVGMATMMGGLPMPGKNTEAWAGRWRERPAFAKAMAMP
jgi:glutathione S-transferase